MRLPVRRNGRYVASAGGRVAAAVGSVRIGVGLRNARSRSKSDLSGSVWGEGARVVDGLMVGLE